MEMLSIIGFKKDYVTDCVMIWSFIEKICKLLFGKVDNNDNLKRETVIYMK